MLLNSFYGFVCVFFFSLVWFSHEADEPFWYGHKCFLPLAILSKFRWMCNFAVHKWTVITQCDEKVLFGFLIYLGILSFHHWRWIVWYFFVGPAVCDLKLFIALYLSVIKLNSFYILVIQLGASKLQYPKLSKPTITMKNRNIQFRSV